MSSTARPATFAGTEAMASAWACSARRFNTGSAIRQFVPLDLHLFQLPGQLLGEGV
ncbi:hypothetical protein [Streptomyces sp. HUAS TT7]|uniref:hypothetical protein n=1 Tax=Streptomyces sp. HUAS TT7 TaxID=3447507 RepID=UPI003F6605A9